MKKGLLLVCLVASCLSCTSSPPDCRRYLTGTFTFHVRLPQAGTTFRVIRQGNKQTEIDQRTGASSTFIVKWLNDCTYQLQLVETTEHFPPEIDEYRRKNPLTTTILGGTDRYYLFRSQRGVDGFVTEDTVWLAH